MIGFSLVAMRCGARQPQEGAPAVLDVSIPVSTLVLDPQRDLTGASATITEQLFAGLMRLDPASGDALPDLAVEPPAVSTDRLTYTFTLRQGAIWVDQSGKPVAPLSAEDVVFTIRRVCDNHTDRRLAHLFYIIKNCEDANTTQGTADLESIAVRAVDDRTVEFALTEPDASFPALLTHWAARPLPRSLLSRSTDWARPGQLWTSGPYLLTDLQSGVSATLVKNPLFYAANSIAISRATVRFIPDPANALTAYARDELDTAPVPLGMVDRVRNDPLFKDQLRQRFDLCTDYLGFTTVKAPLNSREVRLALSEAIDRAALVKTIYAGGAIPAHHLSPPGALAAPPADQPGVQSDAAGARALLTRAGYPGGAGYPPIQLAVAQGERDRQLAAAIQQMWSTTLGIAVHVEEYPEPAFRDILKNTTPLPRAPHVWLLHRCADFPDTHDFLESTFHVGTSPNSARRVATTFEELLDRAAATSDLGTRRGLYVEAEQTLAVTEAAYAPLVHQVSYLVVKPWLTRDTLPFGGLHIRDWTINMRAKLEDRGSSRIEIVRVTTCAGSPGRANGDPVRVESPGGVACRDSCTNLLTC
ncbi:MAG: peptide ABC transporter substrate-binding protein [Ardenticatenaceae bacterium]|nr:peptide ABC transporter substrate-binding protein [Ardenticatenaceae bacterium]